MGLVSSKISVAATDLRAQRVAQLAADIGRLLSRVTDDQVEVLARAEITILQAKALMLLVGGGPLRVSDLAERLRLGLPAASQLVERLVRLGLVVRKGDSQDRRAVHCCPTETGENLYRELAELRVKTISTLLSNVDDAALEGLALGLRIMSASSLTPMEGAQT